MSTIDGRSRIVPALAALALFLQTASAWQYPATKTVDVSDTYCGKTYKDPYRWLEDLKNKDVADWFKAQATFTDTLLAKITGSFSRGDHTVTMKSFRGDTAARRRPPRRRV